MLWARRYAVELTLVGVLALAVAYFGYLAVGLLPGNGQNRDFRGSAALNDIGMQLAYGSRAVGTQANIRMGDWLVQQLTGLGWDVVIQEFTLSDALKGRNLVAVHSPDGAQTSETSPRVGLVVAHYDSRIAADRDANPDNQARPAPGANDGASGAAVLLELARAIDVDAAGATICLAFTDGDANVGVPGWTEQSGSVHLARTLARDVPRCADPAWVVALDRVGSVDAAFPVDVQSNATFANDIWAAADSLGYSAQFPLGGADTSSANDLPANPLLNAFTAAGYPTVVIADPAYPYWGTLADAADKVSAATMEAVGRTVETWIESGQ